MKSREMLSGLQTDTTFSFSDQVQQKYADEGGDHITSLPDRTSKDGHILHVQGNTGVHPMGIYHIIVR